MMHLKIRPTDSLCELLPEMVFCDKVFAVAFSDHLTWLNDATYSDTMLTPYYGMIPIQRQHRLNSFQEVLLNVSPTLGANCQPLTFSSLTNF